MGTVTTIYRAMAVKRVNQKLAEYGELAKSSLQDLAFILANHGERTIEFLEASCQVSLMPENLKVDYERELVTERAVTNELLLLEQEYKKLYGDDMSPVKKIN